LVGLQKKNLFQNHLGAVDLHWLVDNLRTLTIYRLTWQATRTAAYIDPDLCRHRIASADGTRPQPMRRPKPHRGVLLCFRAQLKDGGASSATAVRICQMTPWVNSVPEAARLRVRT